MKNKPFSTCHNGYKKVALERIQSGLQDVALILLQLYVNIKGKKNQGSEETNCGYLNQVFSPEKKGGKVSTPSKNCACTSCNKMSNFHKSPVLPTCVTVVDISVVCYQTGYNATQQNKHL